MKKIGVIGSGPGGLAVAIRLALQNHKVEVFEANSTPGGKIGEMTENGYRFDTGPSLFTLPTLVDELFIAANKNPADFFEYEKLSEVCRYFWEDQTRLNVTSDLEKFDKDVSEILGEKYSKITKYLSESAFKYKILSELFMFKSLHKISTWLSKKAIIGYLNVFRLGIFNSFNDLNSGYFQNPKTIQLFNRYATYNGSSPFLTPATMGIIPHLEYNIGAYLPKKGMFQISESLYRLALDLGVVFHFDTKIEEIILNGKKAESLQSKKQNFGPFDAIVSNMDVTPTYLKLLPNINPPKKLLNQEKSGSALIFYWGIKREFKELGLHNILFSEDYKTEFKHQFEKKDIYKDPTIYINITSKHIPSDAPDGCENWFILINAPSNIGQDWKEIIKNTRESIIKKINRVLKTDIEALIVTEKILDPIKIELNTSSSQGALYGNSSNNRFSAFLRHPNFSRKIPNLYFVGGSVHPGGGIPLALSSAKITSEIMARNLTSL
ncbi:phytoene desaturase [Lacihabitans sp. LS3-19]|uniref:1-hydroxycarotenoid 3,4-desaturase CrtD n=1 Tax=Lacihabitans sp. LS3-19 TaxID=2487335 RepID=UPI0020CC1EBC|nr:1-hydroxycarotenoid 3,4-desaturase CrtD [Lacihabitans sp. LS3-19]MCP9769023.1 phytoene desaturase [Lacihabitans sp. LS3-19]